MTVPAPEEPGLPAPEEPGVPAPEEPGVPAPEEPGVPAPGEPAAAAADPTAVAAAATTEPAPVPAVAPEVEPEPVWAPTTEAEHAVFRVMDLMDIHHDLPSAYPMVTLQEAEAPLRTLSFPVGLPEGTAMAHALRRIATPRPLTHELFADVLARYRVDVVAVRLVGRAGGNYLAEIDFIGAGGREVVPCRPTDALTLALRMPVPAPILCDERLLEDEGEIEPR